MKKYLLFILVLLSFFTVRSQNPDVNFTIENPEITNDGIDNFYEADIFISSSTSFLYGIGQLYITYNTVAFGTTPVTDGNFEYTRPVGSILDEGIDATSAAKFYSGFNQTDNTSGIISINWQHTFAASTKAVDNITSTPKLLLHFKLKYTSVAEDPMICFEMDLSDGQNAEACGPYMSANPFEAADCTAFPPTVIADDIYTCDNAGLPISCTTISTYTILGGWDNGAPETTTEAIIAENYNTAIGDITACSLTVESGATLTIGAGEYVEVQNDITNNGTIIVESTYDNQTDNTYMGSIVQVLHSGTATNNGTINVQYTTPYMVPKTFVVVGSPMTAETRNGVFAAGYDFFNHLTENFVPNPDVAAQFPNAENFADDNRDNWLRYNNAVNSGEGYILRPQLNGTDGNKTYDFTFEQGTLNTGNIDFTVKYNTDKNSSPNVLANPYPSAIRAVAFINENPMVNELYFWNPLTPPNVGLPGAYNMNFSMEDISIYNLMGGTAAASDPTGTATVPSGFISTAEGFGFKATGAGTAHFTNAMRVTENNTTAPRPIPDNNDRVWVTVKNAQYQMQNTTLLGFSELATAGLDQGYDSRRLATVVSLYTHLGDGNKELGIQSRESFEDGAKVLMGFSTLLDANLEYTISVVNIEGPNLSDATVYLIDNELNILTNLNEDNYTFKADKGTYNNRFTIQFKAETILGNQQQELTNIMLIPNPAKDVLNISNPQLLDLESLEIYDIRGRLVQTANLRAMGTVKQIDIQQLASASYFVKIIGKDGQITKRLLKE